MVTDFDRRVGERIRTLRSRVGLTQSELAERSAVSKQTISNLESARWGAGFRTAYAISKGLGVSIEELVKEE